MPINISLSEKQARKDIEALEENSKQIKKIKESMPINKQEELENNLGKIVDKYIVPRTIKKSELFALRWGMYGELETYYKNVMAQSNEWWNQKLTSTKEQAKHSGIEEERKKIAEKLARYFYDLMPYDGQGKKPDWVEGGNSLKQDEARTIAIKALKE